jgi:hypothetical protein
LLHSVEHLAEATEFSWAEEALTLQLRVFAEMSTRVAAVWPEAPHLGKVEHLRDNLEVAVGLVGYVPEVMMEASYVGSGDVEYFVSTKHRQDEAP